MTEPRITRQAVHVSAGSNLPIYRIVIHATCPNLGYSAASAAGTAAGTARYFTSPTSGGSAHYVDGVDREEHCVADAAIAWHAPPNKHSIGIEVTADGGNASAFRPPSNAYTKAQWLSPEVWPAVKRAAVRTRELCIRLKVPIVLLSAADLVAGKRGICGHDDVSAAWKQTNHSDPGLNFPWPEFMAIAMGSKVPTPTPEDDMFTDADRSMLQTAYKLLQEQQIRNAPVVAKAVAGDPMLQTAYKLLQEQQIRNAPVVAEAVAGLPAATAQAVVAALPAGGTPGAVDVVAIAKAVNDDAAKRLAG